MIEQVTCVRRSRFLVTAGNVFAVFFVVTFSVAVHGNSSNQIQHSITDRLAGDQNLSLFTEALRNAGLWEIIDEADQITLFVPTDSALRKEGSAYLLESVLVSEGNEQRLSALLSHHLLDNLVSIEVPGQTLKLTTHAGTCVQITSIGNSLKIGPEAYVIGNFTATNGEIFFIDRLLWHSDHMDQLCVTKSESLSSGKVKG